MTERYVLSPAHLRQDRLVVYPDKEPLVLDWKGLVELVGGSDKGVQALRNLRLLKPRDFVGLKRREDGGVTNFLTSNYDKSGKVDWILRKNPLAFTGLLCCYRVEEALYDAKLQESP